jgi:hypothetical protein
MTAVQSVIISNADMALNEFIAAARTDLADILSFGGRILYSSADTLRPGVLYLLGLNPGADPDGLDYRNIGESLDLLPLKTTNSYVHEKWDERAEPGDDKLQRRVRWLLESLDLETCTVCATNLIFARSDGEAGCGYPRLADKCWPVHEKILGIVQPQAILCFGNLPFDYIQKRGGRGSVSTYPSGHGDWQCRSVRAQVAGRWVNVVGVPHLSRYDICGKTGVVSWIKNEMAKSLPSGQTSACPVSPDRNLARRKSISIEHRATSGHAEAGGLLGRGNSDIPYGSRMYRTGRTYTGRGKRETIWNCWQDGCTVAEFVRRARAVGQGGPEDVRIYWHAGVIRLDPAPVTTIRRPR